jgi:hypothetical protein
MVLEAGVAATDGLPSAKVLPLVGSIAACGRQRCYHRCCLRRWACYHRWGPLQPAVDGGRWPLVLPAVSGRATTGGRRCYLRSPEVLPPVGIGAATEEGGGGQRCYSRRADVLPAVGGRATTGGRCCYLRSPEVLTPVGIVAACGGGGATVDVRRCSHRWVSLLPTVAGAGHCSDDGGRAAVL